MKLIPIFADECVMLGALFQHICTSISKEINELIKNEFQMIVITMKTDSFRTFLLKKQVIHHKIGAQIYDLW